MLRLFARASRPVALTAVGPLLALAGCGPMRSSMIPLEGMAARNVTFTTAGDAIIVEHDVPTGGALVMNEPYLDGDRIVLGALLTSAGGPYRRSDCVDLSRLSVGDDWSERVYWRAPDGTLAHVAVDPGGGSGCPSAPMSEPSPR